MHLNDAQLSEKIRTLLLTNQLSEGAPAFGIAMQVVRYGLGSLSWKQRFIYLGRVVPLLRTMDSKHIARCNRVVRKLPIFSQTRAS
jgi:hypothetical protein